MGKQILSRNAAWLYQALIAIEPISPWTPGDISQQTTDSLCTRFRLGRHIFGFAFQFADTDICPISIIDDLALHHICYAYEQKAQDRMHNALSGHCR